MELAKIWEVLIKNFESTLPPGEYNQLLEIVGSWIKNGGRFEIIRKNIEPLTLVQKVQKFLSIFLKIILILFSTIAWAGVTCWANAMLHYELGDHDVGVGWLVLWGVEILGILFILIRKLFKKKSSWKEHIEPSLLKLMSWLIIVISIIIVLWGILPNINI
jgi:hypothetical protein